MSRSRLYAERGSAARGYADALAWLFRLGAVGDDPEPGQVGVGSAPESGRLAQLVREGALAGGIVLAGGSPVDGRLRLSDGFSLHGPALRLDPAAERPLVRAGRAVLAAEDGDGLLHLATTPERWGALDEAWALPAAATYLAARTPEPLVLLPPIGCLRIDDLPGTAELQLRGRSRDDREMEARIARLARNIEGAGAKLMVAVAARALDREERVVPTDEVWPLATAALAAAVSRGVFEPAAHGLLHLDDRARAEGRIDPREFQHLDAERAGERMDTAVAWVRGCLGAVENLVPPAWGHNEHTKQAAAQRGLTLWLPPQPGPLLDEQGHVRETLQVGLEALSGLDYQPIARVAAAGLPPVVVFHGRLLDGRLGLLRARRALIAAARLAARRDLERIPRLSGIRWVSGSEFVARLRAHGQITVEGEGVHGPPGTEIVLMERGRRRATTL